MNLQSSAICKFMGILLPLIFINVSVFAGNEPEQSSPLLGRVDSVKINYESIVQDNAYFANTPPLPAIAQTNYIDNYVSVGIDEESTFLIQSSFTVSIQLMIYRYDHNNALIDSIEKAFVINYDTAQGSKFSASQYYAFQNAYKVKVKILNIDDNGATWDVSRVLRVDNRLTANRDYEFTCNKAVPDLELVYNTTHDEANVSWGEPNAGQTEFDLEWAWIETDAVSNYTIGGVINISKVFDNNASRISINDYSYNIPLFYNGEGKVYVRVRPVQLRSDGHRIEGNWTWQNTGNTISLDFNGHSTNNDVAPKTVINWQAQTTFAEEGKRKSVVQYFDGTLRSRQTVTKDLSPTIDAQKTTIVSETFYDYQGRAVIQVLPTPTLNNIIEYSQNFNKAISFSGYPKSVYDELPSTGNPYSSPAGAMDVASGSSRYYSPYNDYLSMPSTGYNVSNYIPDAQQHPFTETRYNASGEVALQSGVGSDYKIGSGHETVFLSESPDQQELDALFGTDVGYASHYFKNWVKDANGQYSVSYTDMFGRTVATTLAGNKPDNLDELVSNTARIITKQLIDEQSNRIVDKSIVSTKNLVVPLVGDYTFHYELDPQQLQILTCGTPQTQLCFDCLYNLKITITSDNVSDTRFPFVEEYDNISLNTNQSATNCGTNGAGTTGVNESFVIEDMPEGVYTITKVLTLSSDKQYDYRENVYLANDTCKQFIDFYNEELQTLIEEVNCNLTCESCTTSLGSFNDFKDEFLLQTGLTQISSEVESQLQASYDEAFENCRRLCNASNEDGLDLLRNIQELMLNDVTPPMGQYANENRLLNRYNIFNVVGFKNVFNKPAPAFINPVVHEFGNSTVSSNYLNEYGQVDPLPLGISPQEFTNLFKSSWAKQLLPQHPEYCMLKTAMEVLPPSYAFEAELMKLETWSDVVNATSTPGGYITDLIGNDPFFTTGVLGTHYTTIRNKMLNKINIYSSSVAQSTSQCPLTTTLIRDISMWQMARTSVFCRNVASTCDPNTGQMQCMLDHAGTPSINPSVGCMTDWNMVWMMFKSLYLTERNKLLYEFLELQNCNQDLINGSNVLISDRIRTDLYTPRFIDPRTPTSNGSIDYSNINTLITQMTSGDVGAQTTAYNLAASQYEATCNSYVQTWIAQLENCDVVRTRWETPNLKTDDIDWLQVRLVDICTKGSDIQHPYGSSSIKPGATPASGGFTSFPEVLSYYLSEIVQPSIDPLTELCHPYLITSPAAYGVQSVLVSMPTITKPADCECDRLSTLSTELNASGFSGTLSSYLAYKHGTNISQDDLDVLISLCSGQNTCNFLEEPILLPPVLQCRTSSLPIPKTCIDCLDYVTYKEEFFVEMGFNGPVANPQTENEISINVAFQNFVNFKTGFSKSWTDYLQFEDACDNYTPIPCTALNAALDEFRNSSMYTQNPFGEDCEEAFEIFFNNYFDVFFTFSFWMELFAECGDVPDVCLPVISCSNLNDVVLDFYLTNGFIINQNNNCESLFTDFFNDAFQTNITLEEIEMIYKYVCGCELNICNFPNTFLLNHVYDEFVRSVTGAPWQLQDCEAEFAEFFSAFFNINPPASYQTIAFLYSSFNSSSCTRNISNLCIPEISCETLQLIVEKFIAENGGTVEELLDCQELFEDYFEQQTGFAFSYARIAQIYLIRCGTQLELCETSLFNCNDLLFVTLSYVPDPNMSSSECELYFAEHFNDYFRTDYDFSEILDLYKNMCDIELKICQPNPPTSCEEISFLIDRFHTAYPDPQSQIPEGRCRDVITAMFNIEFGTAYSYEEVNTFFYNLCSSYLDICDYDCDLYVDFVDEFNNNYGSLQIPLAAKKILFTYLYNQRFIWGNSLNPYAATGVISNGGVVSIVPPNGWGGNMVVTYEQIISALSDCIQGEIVTGDELQPDDDCTTLEDMMQVFALMYPLGLPENCTVVFTSWFNFTMQTQYESGEIQQLYDTYCGAGSGDLCTPVVPLIVYPRANEVFGSYMPPLLCGLNAPISNQSEIEDDSPCDELPSIAHNIAEEKWQLVIDDKRNNFDVEYYNKCMEAKNWESFTVTFSSKEYHYTLYYYDQAGNLVKTVPPAGVDAKHGDVTFLQNVKDKRAAVRNGAEEGSVNREVPNHTLTTEYRYNTLNQVIAQKTPDAGISRFWYDRLGRLVVSQNAQQLLEEKYSYTIYDALGRITEVGQKPQSDLMSQIVSRNPIQLQEWLLNDGLQEDVLNKEQITRTIYDYAYDDISLELVQQHLRGRVSYTMLFDEEPDPLPVNPMHNYATYYSYDIHGNVKTLLQDYGFPSTKPNAMNTTGNRFKKMVYDYDLISGKVNEVHYQPGALDAFYHRYEYDQENRLLEVFTSRDRMWWERDAQYTYYRHGPLSRMVLGQQQVQGVDYAYTLQGWLKGINSTSVGDGTYDMGEDGKSGSMHSNIARDAFGFSLNYYNGDYTSINTNPFATISNSLPLRTDNIATGKDLFNGNIRAMLVNIPKLGDAQLYGYSYDQLNRITAMNTFMGLSGNSFTAIGTDNYLERITYDANGNILTYLRNGDAARVSMDQMTYTYKANTNQLDKVVDIAADETTNYAKYNDIKQGQANGNYEYDAIGNLIGDVSENITNIVWNVYGKIQSIEKLSGDVDYSYDASGNRISKTHNGKTTWYVRDASGNVMGIYVKDAALNDNHLTLNEVHLYGSSRLGVLNLNVDMEVVPSSDLPVVTRGNKFFELSNHLGNVLVTISDKRIAVPKPSPNNNEVDYYLADVVTANDYYPFGMQMPERKFDARKYHYGFNGKELDIETMSTTTYDYGFRIYNPGLGKFLSVDPLFNSYPWYTPYQFAGNTPMSAIDLDGLEEKIVTSYTWIDGRGNNHTHVTVAKDVNNMYNLGTGTLYISVIDKSKIDKGETDGQATYRVHYESSIGEFFKNLFSNNAFGFVYVTKGEGRGSEIKIGSKNVKFAETLDISLLVGVISNMKAYGDFGSISDFMTNKNFKIWYDITERFIESGGRLVEALKLISPKINNSSDDINTNEVQTSSHNYPSRVYDTIKMKQTKGVQLDKNGKPNGWLVSEPVEIKSSKLEEPDTTRTLLYDSPTN